ncbi:MAG: ABC transporter substrate-binding protein [Lachnospiraceae bacterium]|nr:ABC transporter substrate-binding protein [Lachnospiraceae bacterium]
MKMKKMMALVLSAAMVCSMSMAGSVFAEEETEETTDAAFVLEYTEDMQEQGYEALELDSVPERVVCLSAAPVLALYELGVNIVGVVNSSVVTWPEELTENAETMTFSVMSDDFDAESVVNLNPDLVMISSSVKDTAGATLESLGIPVYYISAGHTVSYEAIKEETQLLIDAFALDEESQAGAEAILQSFADVEARAEVAAEALAGKTVMVLQSGSDSHYIQTAGGTLGTMAEMIGFTNVYENESSSMVLLDFEEALDNDPDVVMCVGAESAEDHQVMMEAAFAENESYWYSIDAIAEGNVIYLPIDFCSTAGINIVNNLNDLMDTVA